jgi:tetratricopeptide (TPR) repeat protein
MAKKKTSSDVRPEADGPETEATYHESYEKAVGEFADALEKMRGGDFAAAVERFEQIRTTNPDEPVLGERAATYIRICNAKMAEPAAEPASAEDCYYQAVLLINRRDTQAAIAMLERALRENPGAPDYLYARASAWALEGKAESAVKDLREAIKGEPAMRFQAVNDPDFEPIREEPAFIDIIEPTPTGA